MTDPVIDQTQIDNFRQLLANGNRTQMYLDLFEMTGSQIVLNEAYISSFSEGTGGLANTANDIAQYKNPETYTDAVDNFSRAISTRLLDEMQRKLESTGNGYLTNTEILLSAKTEWEARGLGDSFPGNLLLTASHLHNGQPREAVKTTVSSGTGYSLLSAIWNSSVGAIQRAVSLEAPDASPIKPTDFKLGVRMGERYDIREAEYPGDQPDSRSEVFYVADQQDNGRVIHVLDTGRGNALSQFGVQLGDIGVKPFIEAKLWYDLQNPAIKPGDFVALPYNVDAPGTVSIVQKFQNPEQTGHVSFRVLQGQNFETMEEARKALEILNAGHNNIAERQAVYDALPVPPRSVSSSDPRTPSDIGTDPAYRYPAAHNLAQIKMQMAHIETIRPLIESGEREPLDGMSRRQSLSDLRTRSLELDGNFWDAYAQSKLDGTLGEVAEYAASISEPLSPAPRSALPAHDVPAANQQFYAPPLRAGGK